MPRGEQQAILAVPLAFFGSIQAFCPCLKKPNQIRLRVAHPYRIISYQMIPPFGLAALPSVYESTLTYARTVFFFRMGLVVIDPNFGRSG